MSKQESNVIRIGLIDMLSGFLVSSVILMLIIAFNRPVAGEIAGYPRDFIRLEFMLIKNGNINDLDFRKGAKFRFKIETPEGKIVHNKIEGAHMERDNNAYLSLFAETENGPFNALQLWGPTIKRLEERINTDTIYYVMYGVTTADKVENWKFTVNYFDNELFDEINFNTNNQVNNNIDQMLEVKVRWSYLNGSNESNIDYMQLGDNKEFKVTR